METITTVIFKIRKKIEMSSIDNEKRKPGKFRIHKGKNQKISETR